MNITGDLSASFNSTAMASPYSLTAKADLADAGHPVNQASLSGKRDGAGCIAVDGAGAYGLYVATGHRPSDPWLGLAASAPADPETVEPV